MNRFKGLAAHF